MIQTLMHRWERKLSLQDKNRRTLPFDWGFEFLNLNGSVIQTESLFEFNQEMIRDSRNFFAHTSQEFRFVQGRLQFSSSVVSPYDQNNVAWFRVFESGDSSKRAVIVLPQWNANPLGHVGLCKLLARLGITAVRMTLPYHEERNPSGPRADYLVSPNLGRTIQGIRQAVVDARNAIDWLQLQGYSRIGIMGTSVGSCIGFLAYVHDPRLRVGVFHHVSSFFGDVVWNGISTQHVRSGIEPHLTREELRKAWAAISPNSYVSRLSRETERKRLLISARYDLTFPPDLSDLLFQEHHRHQVPYDVSFLPCGHYTSALTPFKHRVGYLIAKYFRKHL
jgi:dienelactone hydrolase